jgi:hypothetical protein
MGVEMSETKTTELKWAKIRPTEETRSRLDRAATEVTPTSGGSFHVVKHPFGTIIACRTANLLLFDVSDGGRPPELLPLAVTTGSASRLLLPTRRTEDFDECCELLGLRDEEERDHFRRFLLPRPTSKGPAVGSGG